MKHRGIETPACMAGRPVDHRGFPLPWFVTETDEEGHWDFANVRGERALEAWNKRLCWISGNPLGHFVAFCVGPMCVINQIAGDPPCRLEAALWAVRICPFMSRPRAKRLSEDNVVDGIRVDVPGIALARNPGVAAVYVTDTYRRIMRGRGEGVFQMGPPRDTKAGPGISWWAEGRAATAAEVWDSVDSGIPKLVSAAEAEGDHALRELAAQYGRAQVRFPPRPLEAAV